jgi:tRNA uracil 4-sulfurtransferase
MPCNAILCRYAEVALKGGNRRFFERLLVKAIRRVLPDIDDLQILRERGRILLHRRQYVDFPAADIDRMVADLPRIYGLSSFSPGLAVPSTLEAITGAVDALFPESYAAAAAAQPEGPLTFRVRARRSDKTFPMISTEIGRHFADRIIPQYERLTVNLDEAALTLAIEVRERWAMVYCQEVAGPGGLPTGSAEHGLALLSGGIDSPVACYLTMKRGATLDFLTFHSYPYTPLETLRKVARLVQLLNVSQGEGRLFACNLAEAQKLIRDHCTEGYRTVHYRRLMMRVATRLAAAIRARFLVTGESIGQVCSQTVPNLAAIDSATELLIIRPLICLDKEESVRLARRIGTMPISAEPCADSCTVFAPSAPATATKPDRIQRDEDRLDMEALLQLALAGLATVDLATGDTTPWPPTQSPAPAPSPQHEP